MSKKEEHNINKKQNKKKIIKTAIISIITVLIIAVLCILSIYYMWKKGFFIPNYVTWNNQSDTFNIGEEVVDFNLQKKELKITEHDTGVLLYENPGEWLISDYFYSDIDSDGKNEVVLVVWKQGSFGEHKPFWYEGKDNKWTQHIFIFKWDSEKENRLKPIWMSSDIGIKAHKVFVDEKNRIHLIDNKGEETVWQWLDWGLTLIQVIKD
ncbi:MAG: hypothetical protein IJ054_06545 [Lachnospiraceae bacterium]|nr:hypothetical protein [Lachnospiraceae bacterium]MBQ9233083.1 hypothetical protein [Lachnospiraceae bacterium]